ncbi:MAG: hypothetical protein HYV63_17190 [Candidatus Schekmanbacteria bacterium]|nr:hypothetical protein [Candidatus Schekmanbacteria bacterium]
MSDSTELVRQAEALMNVESPLELLQRLDDEIGRLKRLREGLAEKYGEKRTGRAGRRRTCREPGCQLPSMSRKHDGDAGYGYCSEHWKKQSAQNKAKWKTAYSERLATARGARGKA